ncbi:MAG: homoserine kinase [Azospirillum brasilense]|nr:MAG: homoserine kinase [Azospirillum brasilense]
MAVYTHLSNEAIAELLEAHYALGPLEYALGIAQGVSNTNYMIATRTGDGMEQRAILTLFEANTRAEDLPFFVALMGHLAARGIACPAPIARRDGQILSRIADKPALIVSFLRGKSRSVLQPAHAAQAGAQLARMHNAVADFSPTRPNALALEGWQRMAASLADGFESIQPGLRALVDEELAALAPHWAGFDALPRGAIHADFFPDNVFFDGEEASGVIDFYYACTDSYAYDLAIAINAWCFDGRACNLTRARAMLRAYQAVRPLTPAEMEALPWLLRGAAMRFLLTRARDWLAADKTAIVTHKDPLEYVSKLKFHQKSVEWGVESGWW